MWSLEVQVFRTFIGHLLFKHHPSSLALANSLNRLEYRLIGYSFLIERCKKHSLSSSSLSFPIEVLSRVMVTCHTLNASMASEPIDPQLDLSRLLFGILALILETYKLKGPLHLWRREHLHLFVYLFVLALKALILFLVH